MSLEPAVSIPFRTDYPDVRHFDSTSDIQTSEDAHKQLHGFVDSEKAGSGRAFKWSRRIMITTEPLWLARVRRHKIRTVVLIFFPSVIIFLLAFFLAPPRLHSDNNNLKFYMGGVYQPNMPFTAGVVPKRFHSSDDYKQYVPLLGALSYGASSVEVAVWEKDNKLLVGDDPTSISPNNTLENLYLKPLDWLLDAANKSNSGNETCGVFATAPYMPLQIVVDIQSDGPSGYELLRETLQPLYKAGYLTTYNTSDPNATIVFSAVTIVGSGNTPLSSILAGVPDDPIRYIFYDAPLKNLDREDVNFTMTLSPLASASWSSTVGASWIIPSLGKKNIRKYVEQAHVRGIQTRFWGTPSIPKWLRNHLWQMLLDEGADWLDVDNLCDAALF